MLNKVEIIQFKKGVYTRIHQRHTYRIHQDIHTEYTKTYIQNTPKTYIQDTPKTYIQNTQDIHTEYTRHTYRIHQRHTYRTHQSKPNEFVAWSL